MMEALVERFPESADAQQALAMLAASISRNEVAERAARRAMELRPDWTPPRLFLVRLLLSDGQRSEARALLEEFVESNPGDRSLKMLYGQLLVDEREFSSARAVFELMLREYPKDPDVLFAVGILSLQLEDLAGARLHFGRLHETGQRQDEAAFYLGQVAERAEDIKTALDWYARVGGASGSDARIRIAFLRAKRGEVAQAREILQRMRDQDSDNAIPLFMVEAEILDEVQRPDEAQAVYDEALAAFPGDDTLLYARGLHAMKLGRIELGERDLRQIIEADPEHADALNALGYTLADQTDRFEEALELIERAHALKPEEPAILDSLGWVYYRLGDLELALEYLQQANDQLEDGEIAAHLGEVLWALGRRAEAWAVWDKAVETHPEHAYLQEVVGRYRLSRSESSGQGAESN
ncbi:MAG: tetratricopeptide repeat protein [Chromatiales bacterium]|nr:tetratricopeptide repeat protein [Chromatiales bacterium]